MEKVREVVDKVTHPKSHSDTAHTGTHTGAHTGTHTGAHTGTHTGAHTGTHTGAHTATHAGVTGSSGTAGPHTSNLANKMDPRVDSDMDGSRNMGAAQYGPGGNQGTAGGVGLSGQYDTAGPHASNLANKADPRVDSDLDGSRNMGAASYGAGGQRTGAGYGSHTTGLTDTTGSTNAGPHSSNLANKVDPRVDSDRDGSRNMGAASYGAGGQHTGAGYSSHTTGLTDATGSTNAGPHSSNLANKLDPRVDSDRDGSRNMGAASYGAGGQHTGAGYGSHTTGLTDTTGSTNAGPHSSNLANKLDPRVDSDRDGSTTVGRGPQY